MVNRLSAKLIVAAFNFCGYKYQQILPSQCYPKLLIGENQDRNFYIVHVTLLRPTPGNSRLK